MRRLSGSISGAASRIAPPRRAIRRIGVQSVANRTTAIFAALELESGLVGGAMYDKRQPHSLPSVRGIKGVDAYVLLRMRCTASSDFLHHSRGVVQVKHGKPPHVPVRVARVRIVGVFDAEGPAFAQRVFDL